MRVTIEKSRAHGAVFAPPSKSMAHRALICAALAEGTGFVRNVGISRDVEATLRCLKALGAEYTLVGGGVKISPINIKGTVGKKLDCGESGSTLRFMIPLCLLFGQKITLTGTKRLFERSLEVYEELCAEKGFLFEKGEDFVTVCGKLESGGFAVKGNVSSQFISGLMFVLPLLEGKSTIRLTTEGESLPYIKMTAAVLKAFGAKCDISDLSAIEINGAQKYSAADYTVEGDFSNAAFLEAFNLLSGEASVKGLNDESFQGDKVYRAFFKEAEKGFFEADVSDCPDLAPVLMAVAAAKEGALLKGTARLKIKESDRGAAMAAELAKLGAKTEIGENSIRVSGGGLHPPTADIDGHNDHRIVMAMAVLLSTVGGSIDGAEAVSKSYPQFFETLDELGIGVKYN